MSKLSQSISNQQPTRPTLAPRRQKNTLTYPSQLSSKTPGFPQAVTFANAFQQMWKRAQGIQALPRWALIGNPDNAATHMLSCNTPGSTVGNVLRSFGSSEGRASKSLKVQDSLCYAGHLQVWPLSKAWTTICDGSAISAFCLLLYASGQGLSYPIWNLLIKNLTEQDCHQKLW